MRHDRCMNRNRWIVVAVVVVVIAAAAFAIFRPDKLFVDEVVDEDLDPTVAALVEDPDAATSSSAPSTTVPPAEPDGGSAATTIPPQTTTTLPPVLGEGTFVSQGGHTVNGTAFVVQQESGRLLVLPELDSENGPDLQLYLSPQSSGSVDGGVKIAPLKGNKGTQTYELPDDLDLGALSNVVIWCERFSTPFGTATLA